MTNKQDPSAVLQRLIDAPVPPTIATDDEFRDIYCQGYRHALRDALAAVSMPDAQHSEPLAASSSPARQAIIDEMEAYGAGLPSEGREKAWRWAQQLRASSPDWEPKLKALIETWRERARVFRTGAAQAHAAGYMWSSIDDFKGQACETCANELEALLPPAPKEPT